MQLPPIQPTVEIDFLPEIYRVEGARRRTKAWQVVVVALFAGMIASALLIQLHMRRSLNAELERIALRHQAAQALTDQLAKLQADVKSANARAELITYLRHPWPRTQILAALVEPMPDTITVAELRIGQENAAAPSAMVEGGVPRRARGNAKPAETLSAVGQDWKQLHDQLDNQITVATLSGVANDVASLHTYLAEVARHAIVAKAEVRSIERGRLDAETFEFRARVVVRPGYGTPGGPEPAKTEAAPPVQAAVSRNPGR